MPRPTCQLNLTLDVPTAEHVEEIAYSVHKRPSGIGRVLLLERLELDRLGWKVEDSEVKELVREVCQLSPEDRDKLKKYIRKTF